MIWTFTQVALGGAIGSVARFAAVLGLTRLLGDGFPYGTALVNMTGSFAMGVLAVLLADRQIAPFLMAGVLGGFTTFSAFSLDAVRLWERDVMLAIAYVAGSVLLSIAALVIGMLAARTVTA